MSVQSVHVWKTSQYDTYINTHWRWWWLYDTSTRIFSGTLYVFWSRCKNATIHTILLGRVSLLESQQLVLVINYQQSAGQHVYGESQDCPPQEGLPTLWAILSTWVIRIRKNLWRTFFNVFLFDCYFGGGQRRQREIWTINLGVSGDVPVVTQKIGSLEHMMLMIMIVLMLMMLMQ